MGGRIVISGTIDPGVTPPLTLTNVVTITSPLETSPDDNVSGVELSVAGELPPRVWLPVIVRE